MPCCQVSQVAQRRLYVHLQHGTDAKGIRNKKSDFNSKALAFSFLLAVGADNPKGKVASR